MDCFLCNFNAVDSATLLLHLNIQHDLQRNSIYKCGFNQCFRAFQNIYTFKKHLKTHSVENKSNTKTLSVTETTTFEETTVPINDECLPNFENVNCLSNSAPLVDSDQLQIADLPRAALLFASGLYADMNLSRSIATPCQMALM